MNFGNTAKNWYLVLVLISEKWYCPCLLDSSFIFLKKPDPEEDFPMFVFEVNLQAMLCVVVDCVAL